MSFRGWSLDDSEELLQVPSDALQMLTAVLETEVVCWVAGLGGIQGIKPLGFGNLKSPLVGNNSWVVSWVLILIWMITLSVILRAEKMNALVQKPWTIKNMLARSVVVTLAWVYGFIHRTQRKAG